MKRKTKENLTVQKQITYSGDVLHFEQQWKCKMTIQAKNIRHIERGKKPEWPQPWSVTGLSKICRVLRGGVDNKNPSLFFWA